MNALTRRGDFASTPPLWLRHRSSAERHGAERCRIRPGEASDQTAGTEASARCRHFWRAQYSTRYRPDQQPTSCSRPFLRSGRYSRKRAGAGTNATTHLQVRRVIEDQQGRIYVGILDSGLAEVVNGKLEPIAGSQAPPFNNINGRFLQDNLGDWWIGTDQGLFRFRGPQCQVLRGQKITPGSVGEASEDATGRIWFGLSFASQTSLCWVDLGWQEPPGFRCAQLKELGAYHIIRDRSGTLWLGSQRRLARFINGSAALLQRRAGAAGRRAAAPGLNRNRADDVRGAEYPEHRGGGRGERLA